MKFNEVQAEIICNKFFKAKNWETIKYKNKSKIILGLNPILVKKENKEIFLYDNYSTILKEILNNETIQNDLKENGGWTASFYLGLEELDILGFEEYFEKNLVEHDPEKYLEDVKEETKGMNI